MVRKFREMKNKYTWLHTCSINTTVKAQINLYQSWGLRAVTDFNSPKVTSLENVRLLHVKSNSGPSSDKGWEPLVRLVLVSTYKYISVWLLKDCSNRVVSSHIFTAWTSYLSFYKNKVIFPLILVTTTQNSKFPQHLCKLYSFP